MKVDCIIVGGGLAGTLLAWKLARRAAKVLVLDPEDSHSCSRLAAGIINPVTGKRLVKSWRFDQLFDFAKETYREMESEWGVRLLYTQRIFRAFRQMELTNQWNFRLGDPGYASLLEPLQQSPPEPELFRQALAYGCIKKAARLDVPQLLASVRKAFAERQQFKGSAFLRETFRPEALVLSSEGVIYGEYRASKLVFCEGWKLKDNPWFGYLPLNPAKGHVLHLRLAQELYARRYIYKDALYFVALDGQTVWCGSDYLWDFQDDKPELEPLSLLKDKAEQILKRPCQVSGRFAAVRPTVRDRRPLLGQHPEYPQLFVFNGLGTKGSSLGPWCAAQMAELLLEGKAVDEELDIRRFEGREQPLDVK